MRNHISLALLTVLSQFSYAQSCNTHLERTTPDSRYELLNNNSEVLDKNTGLIWQRCSLGQIWDGTTCTGEATTYYWADVLQAAKNAGGKWRIPNIKELDSLVEDACRDPAINETIFPLKEKRGYWSSSPRAHSSIYVWVVYFPDGGSYTSGVGKAARNYGRLVR